MAVLEQIPKMHSNPGQTDNQSTVYDIDGKLSEIDKIVLNYQAKDDIRIWRIKVSLPPYGRPSRYSQGSLQLYNYEGAGIFSCSCLGLGTGGGNPLSTDSDTPFGAGRANLGNKSDPTSYGPDPIVITDNYFMGDLKTSGRSGIHIHGGRYEDRTNVDWYNANNPLRITQGCVRIQSNTKLDGSQFSPPQYNRDLQSLVSKIQELRNETNKHMEHGIVLIQQQ